MEAVAPDLAMAVWCVIIAFGGLLTNGCLVFLIITSKELRRKDYVSFILNRALIDLIYSFHLGTLHPIAILMYTMNSDMCAVAGFLEFSLAMGSIYCEPFLVCNRYVSIMKQDQYKKIYTKSKVYLMCAASWTVSIVTTLPHIYMKSLGRVEGTLCSLIFSPKILVICLVINYSFLFVGLATTLSLNCKMFFYLKNHQNQPMTNRQRTKLQRDREMTRFIFVATFLPLAFQSPIMIIVFVQMVMPVSGWFMFAGMGFFMISFVVDPVVTLLMVRPIRNRMLRQFRKVLGEHISTVQVEPVRSSQT